MSGACSIASVAALLAQQYENADSVGGHPSSSADRDACRPRGCTEPGGGIVPGPPKDRHGRPCVPKGRMTRQFREEMAHLFEVEAYNNASPRERARLMATAAKMGAGPVSQSDDVIGFISDTDIDLHNAAVATLTAEVNQAVATSPVGDLLKRITFQNRWTAYVVRWNEWVVDHTGFLHRWSDDAFDVLRLEYEGLRQEWIASGQTTKAPPSTPGTPPGGSTTPGDIGKAVGQTLQVVLVGVFALGAVMILTRR